MNIELDRVLEDAGHRDNIVLLPGDSMVVPKYNPMAVVQGAVTSPSTVLFRPGAGPDYYIDNAGGYARDADEGQVNVQYANGAGAGEAEVSVLGSTPKPGPGSVVTVPLVPAKEITDVPAHVADIAQFVASAATLAIVALRR